jgi:hypothetical protein
MTRGIGNEPRAGAVWKTLVFPAVGLALATGALLGVTGLRTSGFALSLTPRQVIPILAALAVVYAVFAGLILLFTTRARRRDETGRGSERAVFRTLLTVTLWVALVLMFLPLKGSEAFVRADTLTTIQLNLIGLAAVIVVGSIAGWLLTWILSSILGLFRKVVPARGLPSVG